MQRSLLKNSSSVCGDADVNEISVAFTETEPGGAGRGFGYESHNSGHSRRTSGFATTVDNKETLIRDLGLDAVLGAMAGDIHEKNKPGAAKFGIRDGLFKHAKAADLSKSDKKIDLSKIDKRVNMGPQEIIKTTRNVMFETPAVDAETIIYRQGILNDALSLQDEFIDLYDALGDGITKYEEARQFSQPGYARFTTVVSRLKSAVALVERLLKLAADVRARLERIGGGYGSDGRLGRVGGGYGSDGSSGYSGGAAVSDVGGDSRGGLRRVSGGAAVSDGLIGYIREFAAFYSKGFVDSALRECAAAGRITEGNRIVLGAKIGHGLKGADYVIRSIEGVNSGTKGGGILSGDSGSKKGGPVFATVPLNSASAQFKAIELRDAALSNVLNVFNAVVSQTAADLKTLLYELGFYIGCINLYRSLMSIGVSVCFPNVVGEVAAGAAAGAAHDAADALSFAGLSDISLALNSGAPPVVNSLDLDGKPVAIVTGANQGGKSTFLRGVGCAQIMAQCGMFVTANEYRFSIRPRVFTHFCKSEDASMESGKLDEELARLGDIVDRLSPSSLLLMNESFSSTSSREGAAIARETIGAFYEAGIKTIFVTHLYEYAHSLEAENRPNVIFLRADRRADGSRTFAVQPGLSLPTSYGMDLFNEIMPDS